MSGPVNRRTIDLSAYPDRVVIYLGNAGKHIRCNQTMFGFGPNISKAVAAKPDGLLLHKPVFFSFFPMPVPSAECHLGHSGGRSFFEIRAAPVAGTKPISCAAGLKRSTTTGLNRLAYPNLLP